MTQRHSRLNAEQRGVLKTTDLRDTLPVPDFDVSHGVETG